MTCINSRQALLIAALTAALAQTGVTRHVFIVDQGSRPENLARLAAAMAGRRDATLIGLDGNHAKIAAWRREQALARTRDRRPDLRPADGD